MYVEKHSLAISYCNAALWESHLHKLKGVTYAKKVSIMFTYLLLQNVTNKLQNNLQKFPQFTFCKWQKKSANLILHSMEVS